MEANNTIYAMLITDFALMLHKSFILDGTVCPSLRGLTVVFVPG